MSDAGIIAAYSSTKTLSAVYPSMNFAIESAVHQYNNVIADVELISQFNDSLAPDTIRNDLEITQHVYAWTDSAASNFYIVRFTIKNNHSLPISNFYFGVYTDWDIVNPALNKATYYSSRKLAAAFYQGTTTLYTGVMALSNQNSGHYAFDLMQGGDGGIDLTGGFTPAKIYQALTENKNSAGMNSNGNDVANLVSYGPLYINSGGSIAVDYAILAADNEFSFLQTADEVLSRYDLHLNSELLDYSEQTNNALVFPNPAEDIIYIKFPENYNGIIKLEMLDIFGRNVFSDFSVANKLSAINTQNLSKGMYLIHIMYGDSEETLRFVKD
jgi:hypothetical protein